MTSLHHNDLIVIILVLQKTTYSLHYYIMAIKYYAVVKFVQIIRICYFQLVSNNCHPNPSNLSSSLILPSWLALVRREKRVHFEGSAGKSYSPLLCFHGDQSLTGQIKQEWIVVIELIQGGTFLGCYHVPPDT